MGGGGRGIVVLDAYSTLNSVIPLQYSVTVYVGHGRSLDICQSL